MLTRPPLPRRPGFPNVVKRNQSTILIIFGGCILLFLLLQLPSKNPNQSPNSTAISTNSTTALAVRQNRKNNDADSAISISSSSIPPEQLALRREILDLLASDDPRNINKVYNELVPALVKMDPRAAAEFAQSPEATQWRSDLMMVVAQSWAKLNTDDAQAWASQLQNPPDKPAERETILSYVSFAIADTNPERAVQVLEQCPINKARFEIMIENLAQQFADQGDMQPLSDLISKMPSGPERDGYFARIVNAMARTDVVAAATMVSEDIAPGSIQANAAINVVGQWAWNDKAAARQWVDEFPAGEVHDLALNKWMETVAARQGSN